MANRAKRKARVPLVVCEIDPLMFVCFSRNVMREREMFRRLAHRIVDLAVDRGRHHLLGVEVACALSLIGRDRVTKMVTDLVHEVWAQDS